jgi:hypothetical protein
MFVSFEDLKVSRDGDGYAVYAFVGTDREVMLGSVERVGSRWGAWASYNWQGYYIHTPTRTRHAAVRNLINEHNHRARR